MPTDVRYPQFTADELRAFIEAIDGALPARARILLIGGSAAILAYGVESRTNDIDAFEGDIRLVMAAARKARAITGLEVHFEHAAIARGAASQESARSGDARPAVRVGDDPRHQGRPGAGRTS